MPVVHDNSQTGRSRTLRRSAGAAVLGLTMLVGSLADAQTICAPPAAQSALQSRVLQTRLMVAALSCGQRGNYNAFVTRFQNELIVQGKALREFFRVSYGSRAKKRLNKFVTSLANEASAVSLEMGPEFCAQAGEIFANLTELETVAFDDFAADQPFADDHGIASCQAGAASSVKKQAAQTSVN